MSDLKVEDLVRVCHQPANQHVSICGERGYISDIENGYAMFQGLKTGSSYGYSGSGYVPLDCLCLDEGEDLAFAYKLHKDAIAKLEIESKAFRKKLNKKYEELGMKYGVAPKYCEEIYREISALYTEREGR